MSTANNRVGILLAAAAALMLLMPAVRAEAEQYDLRTDMSVSWESGDIIITTEAEIPDSEDNLTTERFRISESVDRSLTEIASDSFDGIYLDSMTTVSGFLKSHQQKMTLFDNLNYSLRKVSSSFSRDFSSVVNVYRYGIFSDLMPILIDHDKPSPVPEIIGFEPSAPFSGIVIFASDSLPLYGESSKTTLKPAVFPRIYDENMNLVASAEMTEPEFLSRWGFAGYTDKTSADSLRDRAGLYPFYTTAVAVFGINETDILISDEAARKLLSREENRRLIREGRIIIIGNF